MERCNHYLKNGRRCKIRTYYYYCHRHDNGDIYGVCCFCKGPCNPCSQCCERCIRNDLKE